MMNYVGSISILDRGDAPAQAIIDKNARSLAQRVADETRDELEKVMSRVDNIYESYEASTQALMEQSTLEYVEDIAELEALIKDQIKKKKYQQQVTIFIVGYENVCGQKLRLLQQVNEFFMDNSKSYEEEDWYPKTPDIDLDDCSTKIEESLSTAKELTEKISTINNDMVEWLTTYAINKASTKSKKKLESALSKAKDDVKAITDQLKSALLANDEKDDLIQTYLKQLEGKTLEAQKFKAAAEVAKKNVQGLEAKELVYQDEIEKRTSAMKQLQEDLRKIQMDASQSKFLSDLNSNRLKSKDSETAVKFEELQTVIEKHKLELQESKRELQAIHQDQIKALHDTQTADLEAVRLEYADMIKKLQDDLHEAKLKVDETEGLVADAADAAEQARQELITLQLSGSTGDSRPTTEIESQPPDAEDDGISRDSSRQKKKLRFDRSKSRSRSRESRPSTKDTRSSKGTAAKVTVTRTTPAAKVATKPAKPESKSPVKPVKETADASIQDEGGDPGSAHVETRQSKRARSTLETVKESDLSADFDDAFDLADENSWALVPVETVPGRFSQYRKMTIRRLSELEEQLGLTVAKTQRKVTTLKSQFQEHKSKWETERKVLIEQVEQAQKLQTEAEKEADVAMTQLEEFINEQERLEEEEEVKRQEVVKGVSKPVMVSIPTQNDDDETVESEVITSSSPQTLTPEQPGAETGAPPPTFVQSEESEHELTNLMQQTDDAKYERQRSDSKVISRRSSSVNSDVAPWLLAAEKKSRLADNDNEEEEEEEEETVARSSASKTSFRTKSERIASEMSKLEEPDEAEEDENEENYEKDEDFVTDEDNIVKEGTITSKKSHSSQERRSVASKLSKKTLSRNTTREETQEVFRSGEATPGEEGNDGAVELDQESKESRSSKVPSQIESERSKVTQEGQRSKSKISVSQDEVQRSPSQAGEAGETEEETVLQPGSHNRSRRGSRQSRSQTRSNMKRRSSVKSIERAESQKSKMSESGAASRKSNQSIGTPRKSDQEGSNISRRMSDLDLEDESAQMVEDGKVESRKSNSDVLSRRSTQLSKHLTVEEIGDVVIAEDSVLTERSRGDGEMYSEETEDEPIFDVQVVTQDKSDSRASRQHMSVDISLEPLSRSGTAQDQYASPRSLSKVQEMNRKSSGALSAPPAIEPESEIRDKTRSSMSAPRSPPLSRSRGSVVSQYVTRGMTGTTPIEELSEVGSVCTGKSRSRSRSAGSGASKEWILHVTPRYRSRQGSAMSGHDTIDALIVEDNLPQCQSSALHNMKSMMEEENMSNIQHHTLESVRSALKTLNKKDQELSALQLERTITLISLASQLTEESIQLGVLPESVFDAFAEINSRAMSKMSHREEDYLIDDAQGTEFLQPTTQGSVLTEQSLTNETSSGSLKQLPPLESFLLSGQSQRLMGSRQRSLKLSSAPLDMSKYQERARTDSNMALQGPLMTFATMATGGSTRKSSPITPRPKSVTKLLSRSQLSRTKRADIGLTFGSPEYFEYPGNEEGYLYHGIKVCDHGTSPIFQLILYDNGTSPMYQICDGSDDITVTSDPAIVPHLPETVENSDRSENIESSDLSEIIENCNKSENGQNSGHSEILDNGDKFENVENLNKTELENLEMSGDIENNDQSEILSDEMISLERLENVQKSEIQTAFDSTKQGGLQTLEVLTNSVTMEMNENSDMIDPSPFALTEQQDNSLIEQSKMCSGDFNKSQASNENQSENVIESTSPNQSKQSSYDKTNQNENQTEGTNSGEKISQSNLKVSLSVSDCSTKVESKGSSAGSRSEVMDSKYVKKVDITYLTDQHADDKDDEENWNSNHVDEIEVKGQRDSDQNPDTLPSHINENIETDDFRNDTIRIGSKQKQFVPDVKTQRKVIRSEVRIPEVMTQQFDPSLYDREKLKVTGLPFKKDDNFSEVGYYVSPSSRKPSKVRRSKISDSELSGRTLVLAPEPTQLEREPVSLIIKKAEVSSQFNVDTTRLESCERQIVDTEVGEELSVKKSFSKTDRVENFRPVQQFRETIEENSVLTIHTEMQGIMGDCVTHPETQTQIVPKTEEELRATSALSRASLRKEYRNKLGEVRAAVEDRRTKSPAISIPSQRSLEDDQLIDEDDDDDIPYNDIEDMKREQTMEMGTSPPPGHKGQSSSRLSQTSVDHPVVTEYLRLYDGVVQFRNALSKLMIDRDMLQPGEILEDIDTMKFNSAVKVEPQIEGMTHNVYHVFEEIISVLSSLLLADREPMVSSLTGGGMMISRDTTQAVVGPKSAESGRGPTVTRASHHSQFSAKSDVSDRIALRELQEQYDRLQHQLTSDTRKHEEQLRHNTVVMMEMQDTINDLQRELANLGRSSSRLRPQSDTTSPHGTTDSAIMFTRLDSERNSKIMKRAVNDQKMNADAYKDAVVKMEDYVGLPAQRFAHLVRKYVHHSRMKEIEENVKKSRSLNENVFEILDKMEALQNERAKTWADKMDQMGSERLRLANLLMETLDSIEQESGIFLIKPMYSYRGRDIKDARYGGKLTRPMRPQRNISPTRENQSSFAPAPTPASNMRLIRGQPVPTTQSMTHETTMAKQEVPRPLEGDEGGITGSSLNWVGTSQKQTWSMNSSVVRGDPESFLSSQNPNAMNTPRILELDINRMLIGQNTISSKITQPGMTEDRLVNASQNNLRSYITVNRPTAVPGNARPRSFASSATKEYVPPSSPVSQNTKRVRMSEGDMSRADMSRNMTNTPPLPPIGSASSREMPGEPPRSPPGSSMRQSPPHVQEVISPLK